MQNKPYDWSGDRGDRWRDHLPHLEAMLNPIHETLLEALAMDAAVRVADIGCGGGATTRAVLASAPTGSVSHGYDISASLVEAARAHSTHEGLSFACVDAASHTPDGAPYDRLTSRFGVMFFPEPEAAFANLRSWLAAHGRVAFAVWGPARDNVWNQVIREVLAEFVEIPTPDPDAPGPFRYADAERMIHTLDAAGFCGLEIRDWRGTLPVGGGLGAGDAARFACRAFGGLSRVMEEASPRARDVIHSALERRLQEHVHDGVVAMGARAHIITGAAG